MVMFQVSMALMTGKSKHTNLLFLAGIQSPLIKSLCGPLVLLDRRAQSCFAFWCLHHCNCGLSHRALLMSPYGKNKPNNMHAKQTPSSAQCSHSLIIFTWGVSQLRRQEVAFGCFIVLTRKNARRRVQGGNYTLCLQICVSVPVCSTSKMAHAEHNALMYAANVLEYSASVSSEVVCVETKIMLIRVSNCVPNSNVFSCFKLLWLLFV